MGKQRSPRLYVIAGPNGAGKTTFAKEFLPHYAKCENFVNADLIAGGLSPFSPEAAAMRAGRTEPQLIAREEVGELHVLDQKLLTTIMEAARR